MLKCLKCGSTELHIEKENPIITEDACLFFVRCEECRSLNQLAYTNPHITCFFADSSDEMKY